VPIGVGLAGALLPLGLALAGWRASVGVLAALARAWRCRRWAAGSWRDDCLRE